MTCGGKCTPRPRYDKTVIVEKQGTAVDENGQLIEADSNWISLGIIRGRFITRTGGANRSGNREARVFMQVIATVTTIFVSGWSPKWESHMQRLPECRLKMGTRKFNIHAAYRVNESDREIRWELEELK